MTFPSSRQFSWSAERGHCPAYRAADAGVDGDEGTEAVVDDAESGQRPGVILGSAGCSPGTEHLHLKRGTGACEGFV